MLHESQSPLKELLGEYYIVNETYLRNCEVQPELIN